MTRVEKELVLKDICARLPYGFTVHRYSDNRDITFGKNVLDEFSHFLEYSEGKEFKLYLRPMESMTEEEKKDLSKVLNYEFYIDEDFGLTAEDGRHRIRLDLIEKYTEWFIAKHFDYRGLIPMGLALEATKEMYE